MTERRLYFMSHPVGGDVEGNVRRAHAWLRYLRASLPHATVIAPWLASIASGERDDDPEQRERGLVDCETVVARCDGLILCGGALSVGMHRELEVAIAADIDVDDLTDMGANAPTKPRLGLPEGRLPKKRRGARRRR